MLPPPCCQGGGGGCVTYGARSNDGMDLCRVYSYSNVAWAS